MGGLTLFRRAILIAAGAAAVLAAAYAVFAIAPADVGPEPGEQQAVTERVEYWTPAEGQESFLRPRTDRVQETPEGLELVRRLEGPHSPRGDEFRVGLEEGWRLAEEPAAHAAFPATSLWEKPPDTVYVGVPWQTQGGDQVALFDDFHRLHEVEQDGLTLVKYKAREPNQFLRDGDTVWFRAAERTALVEPISGAVVDYHDEETLWRSSLDDPVLLSQLRSPREDREKVWEASIEPTPSGQARLAEQAKASRADQLVDMVGYGLPALLVAEGLMAAGLVGRPKRWLQPGS